MKNIICHNLWDGAKAVLTGKCIVIHAFGKEEERS